MTRIGMPFFRFDLITNFIVKKVYMAVNKWNPVGGPGFPYKFLKENLLRNSLRKFFVKKFIM